MSRRLNVQSHSSSIGVSHPEKSTFPHNDRSRECTEFSTLKAAMDLKANTIRSLFHFKSNFPEQETTQIYHCLSVDVRRFTS